MILHLIAVPALQRIPIYIWDLGDSGNFYKFPMESEHEDMVKTAFHSTPLQTGSASSSSIAVSGHPADIERLVSDDEVAAIRAEATDPEQLLEAHYDLHVHFDSGYSLVSAALHPIMHSRSSSLIHFTARDHLLA